MDNSFRISWQMDPIGVSHARTVPSRVFTNVSLLQQEAGGMGANTKQRERGPSCHFE